VTITTVDGIGLESRWNLPAERPQGVAVLCHPHPLDGGTMNAPLMRAVTASLAEDGRAVLRFNFRGVGASEGRWGSGIGEVDDVAAAVAAARRRYPDLPLGLAGWSFGALTSLRWQARERSTLPWAGIAPPLRLSTGGDLPDPSVLAPARRLFIIGDRDQFTRDADLAEYARRAGGSFRLLQGSDHFFYFRERRVGSAVAGHLAGRSDLDAQ
jgi:alpha/beta superfamily hydrolase